MTTTTEALVLHEINGPLSLETIELTPLQPDEALVQIHATGICHTDLSCMNGTLPSAVPHVLGHEGAGTVLSTGQSIKNIHKGDKVLLSYTFCTQCQECTSDHPAYCQDWATLNFGQRRPNGTISLRTSAGSDLHGSFFGQSSFSRLAIVNRSSLVKVAHDAPLALLAPLGCGIQTGVGAILNTLNVQQGSSVVVFGAGAVGMSAIMAAKMRGASVIVAVDLLDNRLELATKLGATHTFLGSDPELISRVQSACGRNGAQYSVDCTGVPAVVETAIACLGTRGVAATVGAPTPGKKAAIDIFAQLVMGKTYVGCCEGDSVPSKMIPYLMDQYAQGNFPLDEMITYYPIREYEKAIHETKDGKTLKAVLLWD
ncbi:chaperonin 10-like protein [Aspergillus avenaceus]|uniref:Chaperonin 10-like protein n=1 Tax=Aspergillus avenaceus TaxID=36643 RepID=A0A5N6TXQ1_ASPAV|nr:chaperonin 10-like protein [Aspergillus avenaceus]